MFERFTDRARRILVIAQQEARALGHHYIGTEHLLLGLADSNTDIAVKALIKFAVTQDNVRTEIEEIVGRGEPVSMSIGHIPFTSRAKRVLELSLRETLQLGQDYIGPQHILLGIIREGEGVAVQTLRQLDVDLGKLRQEVVRLVSDGEFPPAPPRPLNEIREEIQAVARQLLQTATISSTPNEELLRVIQECSAQLSKSRRELERH